MLRMRNTKCYGIQAITIEGQNAFAPTLCLPKFHVTDGHNMGDQIAFYAFHLFLVEVQTKAGYIHATNA